MPAHPGASPPPSSPPGHVTLAQISDLHLGIMLGDGFLDRVIAKGRRSQRSDLRTARLDFAIRAVLYKFDFSRARQAERVLRAMARA